MDEEKKSIILIQECIAGQWVTVQRCPNTEEAVKVLVELERRFPSVEDSPRYRLIWEDDI